jgi:hypothetical protein
MSGNVVVGPFLVSRFSKTAARRGLRSIITEKATYGCCGYVPLSVAEHLGLSPGASTVALDHGSINKWLASDIIARPAFPPVPGWRC